ncbi:uncharacterized protein si:dkeyp-121d4.3 isoform X3 [Platichthys flesus]|uniref:uncharacterized protein si:dkeyp-121d4.3 isoform X3 n=1 Tax=Platichthys flesus TaxID=8260 RepID=UPI002DBFB765|nr:uncharacterized protein si:dkeyp-121d4.3 isoform X3 [Platichthys flesus]
MGRDRPPMGPPGEDGPPFDMGPPGWGPPPPEGWGPPRLGGWGPPQPEGWHRPPDEWGPHPPGVWAPPPPEWDLRGPPHPDWGPRGPPQGWGPHPDDWLPPPEDWRHLHPEDLRRLHPEDWRRLYPEDWRRLYPEDWKRFHPEDWGPDRPPGWGHPGWGPEGPPEPWGPEAGPPGPVPPLGMPPPPPVSMPPLGIPPPPPVSMPPPDPAAFAPVAVPPVPPPGCVPPYGFPAFPPPGWAGETIMEEPMPNPPPDQPEWIKALISVPPTESTQGDTKKSTEEPADTETTAATAPAPKPEPKPEPSKAARALGLLGKRTFDKPPPGRSTGIISFIGPTFGYIEREDLEKFTFSFEAFFGNPKAMTPGVRVHFTGCKEKNILIATDVKVAPGGTENVDSEIYEAVVTQPIVEPQVPGERQYPGQVYVNIGPLRTNLTFDRKDSAVTLLKNDQVLINLLVDIVTEKRRATNIKPKIPATFSHTNETREKGVIISLKDNKGIIKSKEHDELPFVIKENFSDVEFSTEDINEEVEFSVVTLLTGKQAVRIRRVKEPLLLMLSTAKEDSEVDNSNNESNRESMKTPRGRANLELGPHMWLDTELYEGIVSQPIIEPTPVLPGYPGQIHANIGPVRTNVTFSHRDCGVTLLKNDHVLINLLVDMATRKKRAANIKPKIPFTFSYTKETRQLGIITYLGSEEGIVNTNDHQELPFDVCENFSDSEFNSSDIHKQVEFTTTLINMKRRAIRLRRTKRVEDKILEGQKRREEEEKKKKKCEEEEKEKKKREEDERKRRREEEEQEREAERRKKEDVAAALASAKDKWTPLGFTIRHPGSMDAISKERFEGTVLRAISKIPRKEMKKEAEDPTQSAETEAAAGRGGGSSEDGHTLPAQVDIKVEKTDEDEKEEAEEKADGEKGKVEVKKDQPTDIRGGVKPQREMGRLVMTVDGQQKQLPFSPSDLLSSATMLDGDKVRFNMATNRETKEERATFVEILPDSFEESTEQRRHGIVIEFSADSGMIKCSQNPQLFFRMAEVIEKKKLELNEKVEFSVVPHETAEGGTQAIRIRRHTESVFLPVRKLGGVGANKGKMTIKLTKASEETKKEKPETDKLKAVVKSLRAQDSKTGIGRRDHSASRRRYGRSRSRSKSPARDQFGRIIKRRRSPSPDRVRKSSRHRRSKSRTKSRSKSSSRSRSRSHSRSRDRSKDRAFKKRSKTSREREEGHKRRRELSPPPRRGVVDDELARKKRELEELNEMIAYKKSLVEIDPSGLEPGQRTCIDYDHGRIAMPLAEYKPVRSILKKRPEGPEHHHRPPQPYDDPYYDRPYSPYQDRQYSERGDLYPGRAYADRPYSNPPYSNHPYDDRPYVSRHYVEPPCGPPTSSSHRYTDRYDVYDEAYDHRSHDPARADQPYSDQYRPVNQSQSPGYHDPSQSTLSPASTQASLTHSSFSKPSFRPSSPTEPPPTSPSPNLKNTTPPPAEKPPLDRFLDMLNKKVGNEKRSEPIHVNDDLLPHERALLDGGGFSRIVGLAQNQPSSSRAPEGQNKQPSPKHASLERTSEELKSKTEPYDKIQSLLRTIGLKLSTGDMSKLASRAQEKIYGSKSSSTEREDSREQLQTRRLSSVESDHINSPSPVRSSSLEPLSRECKAVSEYEEFLDQQELEALKKARQLQSLTKTMGSTLSTTSPRPPPGPPPAQYQRPPTPINWPLGVTTHIPPEQSSTTANTGAPTAVQPPQRFGFPPGPPPGPPPRRPSGQPPFVPSSNHKVFSFIGQPSTANDSSPPQTLTSATITQTPLSSSSAGDDQSAISTTVARCLKVIETVKSLAVQTSSKPVKSVQFSLPTESPSASSPQTTGNSEDDIKAKQREKLDLYNQRISEKREQQFQEMKTWKRIGDRNKDGTLIPQGSGEDGAPGDSCWTLPNIQTSPPVQSHLS